MSLRGVHGPSSPAHGQGDAQGSTDDPPLFFGVGTKGLRGEKEVGSARTSLLQNPDQAPVETAIALGPCIGTVHGGPAGRGSCGPASQAVRGPDPSEHHHLSVGSTRTSSAVRLSSFPFHQARWICALLGGWATGTSRRRRTGRYATPCSVIAAGVARLRVPPLPSWPLWRSSCASCIDFGPVASRTHADRLSLRRWRRKREATFAGDFGKSAGTWPPHDALPSCATPATVNGRDASRRSSARQLARALAAHHTWFDRSLALSPSAMSRKSPARRSGFGHRLRARAPNTGAPWLWPETMGGTPTQRISRRGFSVSLVVVSRRIVRATS